MSKRSDPLAPPDRPERRPPICECGTSLRYQSTARGIDYWRCPSCGNAYWWNSLVAVPARAHQEETKLITDLDLSGSWDEHIDNTRAAIAEQDRQAIASASLASQIPVMRVATPSARSGTREIRDPQPAAVTDAGGQKDSAGTKGTAMKTPKVMYPGGVTDREHAIIAAHRWQVAHAAENSPTPTEAYIVISELLGLLPYSELTAAIAKAEGR